MKGQRIKEGDEFDVGYGGYPLVKMRLVYVKEAQLDWEVWVPPQDYYCEDFIKNYTSCHLPGDLAIRRNRGWWDKFLQHPDRLLLVPLKYLAPVFNDWGEVSP